MKKVQATLRQQLTGMDASSAAQRMRYRLTTAATKTDVELWQGNVKCTNEIFPFLDFCKQFVKRSFL